MTPRKRERAPRKRERTPRLGGPARKARRIGNPQDRCPQGSQAAGRPASQPTGQPASQPAGQPAGQQAAGQPARFELWTAQFNRNSMSTIQSECMGSWIEL